jgi:hypothetical protein
MEKAEMKRNGTSVVFLVNAGMLLWFCTGAPLASVKAERPSGPQDPVIEWHIRLRGTKA